MNADEVNLLEHPVCYEMFKYSRFLFQQHLDIASGENRHATHRSQRWYDVTEHAWWQTRVGESELSVYQSIS